MASIALEEKITKIRLRNEEIKRRYEEVEADKKNAAESDALMKPVPSEDWPTRKEPPEFAPLSVAKHTVKPKHSVRKYADQQPQHYIGAAEGKKNHSFADGQGPPPDPKYNFLADSEREERGTESPKDSERGRGRNKSARGGFKRRGSGRDWHATEHWNQHEARGNPTHPEYEAWRAERNRIDEARISRQRTAEGNWRREWDNDKIHLTDETTKRESRVTLGDVVTRQEQNESDKHYRSPRTMTRFSHSAIAREAHQSVSLTEPLKSHGVTCENEKRVVVATDKSIKVLLNAQTSTPTRSPVVSVKVSPPNIVGSGRVGPRQRPRVTYSSQSEAESSSISENPSFVRQRSMDESTKVRCFDQPHKNLSPRSPRNQRKSDLKNSYQTRKEDAMHSGATRSSRKESERFEEAISSRKDSQKSPHPQKRPSPSSQPPKFSRDHGKPSESFRNDSTKSPKTREKKTTEIDGDRKNIRTSNESADTIEPPGPSDKSSDLPSQVESRSDENASSDGQGVGQISANPAINDNSRSIDTRVDAPTSPGPAENHQSLENYSRTNSETGENEMPSNVHLDDSTNRANSLDDTDTLENEAIDCSADSGIISNDSGFVELLGNDCTREVSDGAPATKGNYESSQMSMQSTSQAEQRPTVDEVQEMDSTLDRASSIDVVGMKSTSANDTEATADRSHAQSSSELANGLGDAAIVSDTDVKNRWQSREKNSAAVEGPCEVPESPQKPSEALRDREEPAEVPQAQEEPTEAPQAQEEPTEVPHAEEEPIEVPQVHEEQTGVPQAREEPIGVPQAQEKRTEVPRAHGEPTEASQMKEVFPKNPKKVGEDDDGLAVPEIESASVKNKIREESLT